MASVRYGKSFGAGDGFGFEAQLWAATDKMHGHMDAAEYKHVCLGLISLKYISDAFDEKREQLLLGISNPKSEWCLKEEPARAEAAERRDGYLAANASRLPPEDRTLAVLRDALLPKVKAVEDGKEPEHA